MPEFEGKAVTHVALLRSSAEYFLADLNHSILGHFVTGALHRNALPGAGNYGAGHFDAEFWEGPEQPPEDAEGLPVIIPTPASAIRLLRRYPQGDKPAGTDVVTKHYTVYERPS